MAERTFVLFAAGDPAEAGGGTIRDQLLHTSEVVEFGKDHNFKKLTIPIDNELDEQVDVKVYGRTETDGDPWHQLGATIVIAAAGQAHATLTDNWLAIKMTVQASDGADPTAGDFKAKMMPVQEGL